MKEKNLKDLEKRIENSTNKEVWFYPEHEKIKGWMGTQNIFFVGSNPSCNTFPTRHTDLFYRELENNGFEKAHLTDLIKIRATNKEAGEVIKKYFGKQIKFFEEEIDILKPKLIVIMGGKAKKALGKFGDKYKDIRFHCIYHYSQRISRYEAKFKKQIKEVKNLFIRVRPV